MALNSIDPRSKKVTYFTNLFQFGDVSVEAPVFYYFLEHFQKLLLHLILQPREKKPEDRPQ